MSPRSKPPPPAVVSAKAGLARNRPMKASAMLRTLLVMLLPLLAGRFPSTAPLSSPPTGTDQNRMLMIVAHAERDVDRAQHREHECLHDADERAEQVEEHGDPDLRETGEDAHHLVVREHVGEETNAERDGPE